MRWVAITISMCVVLLIPAFSLATVINIPSDYATIQEGIINSNNGDTVLVENGIYNGGIDYNGKNITVASRFLFTESQADIVNTIITGGDIYFVSGESNYATLYGFTVSRIIVQSASPKIKNNIVKGNPGISVSMSSSPNINDCSFENNQIAIALEESNGTISGCTFSGNQYGIVFEGNGYDYWINNCSFNDCETGINKPRGSAEAYIDNCTFNHCSLVGLGCMALDNCDILNCDGIALSNTPPPGPCSIDLNYCSIENSYGYFEDYTAVYCENTTIINSSLSIHIVGDYPGAYIRGCNRYGGGGIYVTQYYGGYIEFSHSVICDMGSPITIDGNYGVSIKVESSTIIGNQGGGIEIIPDGIYFRLLNNIIADNSGPGVYSQYAIPNDRTSIISCNNLHNNSGGDYGGAIPDQTGLNGNISENPQFCGALNNDFHIFNTSPCAPANNICGILMGALGVGCYTPMDTLYLAGGVVNVNDIDINRRPNIPLQLFCLTTTATMSVPLKWDRPELTIDSISVANTACQTWTPANTISNSERYISMGLFDFYEDEIQPGWDTTIARLFFSSDELWDTLCIQFDTLNNPSVAESLYFVTPGLDTFVPEYRFDQICLTYTPGDCYVDGNQNIVDITFMINYQFKSGEPPVIKGCFDVNGDCTANILDIIYYIDYKFKGGPALKYACSNKK